MADLVTVTIDKLVHGGQGLGTLESGQKIFVWNALPGETVEARVIKRKRSYLEAVAEQVSESSPDRIEPLEDNYLSTSPWQVMSFAAENTYKKQITLDLFAHEKVSLPDTSAVVTAGEQWLYRNKMEYSFWGDDDGLHLALHRRGSHGKQIVSGSQLAMPVIDEAARALLGQLQALNVRAGDLKTVVLRTTQAGKVAASLFVKPQRFPQIDIAAPLSGLRVYHSNPKSPASIATELLYEVGDCQLSDVLLGQSFAYDVDSFFQVNIPIFERALVSIKERMQAPRVTDMYAGVGSIGLSVADKGAVLVELDIATANMAAVNAAVSPLTTEVIETSSERSLDYITADCPVIVDPPRAGLHKSVVQRLLETRPPTVAYLSCNPATQARDISVLQDGFAVTFFEIYNFFPHTPHIESLAILTPRE